MTDRNEKLIKIVIIVTGQTYFDFGFIGSFIGIRHFGALFLSLSVCLHHSTQKGTFILFRTHRDIGETCAQG